MVQALQSAAAGLISSANSAAVAAQDVVVAAQSQSSTSGADTSTLTRGNAAYQLAAQSGGVALPRSRSTGWNASSFSSLSNMPADFQNPAPSLEESIIHLKMATQAYKANAAVFRAVSRTMGALLEIKS